MHCFDHYFCHYRADFKKIHHEINRINPKTIQVTCNYGINPYRIDQLIMSFTLLTFANSFPDMVTSILMAKEKEEGPYVSLAGLFATFIFQTTITIAFVIFNSDFEVEVNSYF